MNPRLQTILSQRRIGAVSQGYQLLCSNCCPHYELTQSPATHELRSTCKLTGERVERLCLPAASASQRLLDEYGEAERAFARAMESR